MAIKESNNKLREVVVGQRANLTEIVVAKPTKLSEEQEDDLWLRKSAPKKTSACRR